MVWKAVFCTLFIISQWNPTEGSCYFPQDFQGDYVMQVSTGIGPLQYSTLNIKEDSIPVWGNCHRRIGNNFILIFNNSETNCIKCVHMKLRSSSVLQVFASNAATFSKCLTTEESAEAECLLDESVSTGRTAAEILLFKTRDVQGEFTSKQYCPFDGKFTFKYKSRAPESEQECFGFGSVADSCPSGSTMNFRPRNCTTTNYDINFDCLAHWKDLNDETYIIFSDGTRDITHTNKYKPLYRCGVYKQDKSGKIFLALSSDSTCTNDLHNATSGYETFELEPTVEKPWPLEVTFPMCNFPEWMFGDWEHLRVENNTMIYRDHTSFKTYTIKCVGAMEGGERYLVFTRTQCDEEFYNCLRIANRSHNILEFQIGRNSSIDKNTYTTLCSEENFQEDAWITQGRSDITPGFSSGMCPITGEYTGVIPDGTDLCAKLWSDCRAPELMYYQVSHCRSGEVYEEREYQCLGHWREMNLLYTYTQRNDVASGTHECFVGSIVSDKDIFIKEAGGPCQRNVDPLQYGMQLTKLQSPVSCIEKKTTQRYVSRTTTESHFIKDPTTAMPTTRTTASQDFDMDAVTENNEIPSSATKNFLYCYYYFFFYLYIFYL